MGQVFMLFLEFLTELFILVATIGLIYGINLLRKNTKNKLILEIVEKGILFAQQKYLEESGSERYQQALNRIEILLSEKNIDLSAEQLDTLIESTLKRLKNEFEEQWYQ